MLRNFALGILLGFVVVWGAGSCGAHAAGYTASWSCQKGYTNCSVTTGYIEGADAKVIHVPSNEGSIKDKSWEAFCQPKEERGEHGVIYLRYAHAGCEYGRTR